MIKVISFDVGGTLLKTTSDEDYSLNALALLLDKSYYEIRKVYKNVFQKQYGDFNTLVSIFCQKIGVVMSEKVIDFFHKKFETSSNTIINPEAIDIIHMLREQGYIIILFSNSCCLVNNDLNELHGMIDYEFYSYNIGYTKNEKESYEIIENKLGYKANEFLHVGDNLNSDYYSPINNGWYALYYGNDSEVHSINNLNEIGSYLNEINTDYNKDK